MKAHMEYSGEFTRTFLNLRGITDEFDQEILINSLEVERNIVPPALKSSVTDFLARDNIFIYGDYDADGVCSAGIAKQYLADAPIIIPDREDGYGLKTDILLNIGKASVLTVDCGIRSGDIIDGFDGIIDFMVTDHHQPHGDELSCITINPHVNGPGFRDYSGSGVIYKVMKEVYGDNRLAKQLAAIGTIVDLVPVLDENRKIIREGLWSMMSHPELPIRSLAKASGTNLDRIAANDIAFSIGPIINSASRMNRLDLVMQLLLEESESKSLKLAKELVKTNTERKQLVKNTLDLIQDANYALRNDAVIVVLPFETNAAILGLIASKIQEDTGCPVIACAKKQSGYIASARSSPWFDCAKMVNGALDMLSSGGGHKSAAGFTIREEQFNRFVSYVDAYASEMSTRTEREKPVDADFEIEFDDAIRLVRHIEELAPYGNRFGEPMFLSKIPHCDNIKIMGKTGDHVSFEVEGTRCAAFFLGSKISILEKPFSMLYSVGRDTFGGKNSPMAIVRGLSAEQ